MSQNLGNCLLFIKILKKSASFYKRLYTDTTSNEHGTALITLSKYTNNIVTKIRNYDYLFSDDTRAGINFETPLVRTNIAATRGSASSLPPTCARIQLTIQSHIINGV